MDVSWQEPSWGLGVSSLDSGSIYQLPGQTLTNLKGIKACMGSPGKTPCRTPRVWASMVELAGLSPRTWTLAFFLFHSTPNGKHQETPISSLGQTSSCFTLPSREVPSRLQL